MQHPILGAIMALTPQAIIVVGTVALLSVPAIAYLIVWLAQREESDNERPTPARRHQSDRTIPGGSGLAGQ